MSQGLKTEISVSTWLAVIADMGRSRLRHPTLGATPEAAVEEYLGETAMESVRFNPPIGQPDQRRALIRIAALSMRMLDEWFPGDGLEL